MEQTAAQPRMPIMVLRDNIRDGRREAVLVDDWLYHNDLDGKVYLVPASYTTDFASIPLAARIIADQYGRHAEASVIHDWLYATGNRDPKVKGRMRKYADDVFLHAMEEQRVNWVTRSIMYRAVRLLGWGPYGKPREWDQNWSSLDTENVGGHTAPTMEKPTDVVVANVSKSEFAINDIRLRIKFLRGTVPDKCSKLEKDVAEYSDAATGRDIYISDASSPRDTNAI